MTDKVIIQQEIERRLREVIGHHSESDIICRMTYRELLDFIDSIKNQIWHDANEEPEIDRNILLVAPNGNSSLALWDGKEFKSCTLGGGHSVLCENDKWAYIDDLINL